jgi:hypothetical protein
LKAIGIYPVEEKCQEMVEICNCCDACDVIILKLINKKYFRRHKNDKFKNRTIYGGS